jgi:hypothetical protein
MARAAALSPSSSSDICYWHKADMAIALGIGISLD